MTIDEIRKTEKILMQKELRIAQLKEELKELKAQAEETTFALRRAIRGDEPELQLQFINVKTGEVVKTENETKAKK